MIICEAHNPETGALERVAPDDARQFATSDRKFLWVDLDQPTEGDYGWLREAFGFHPLAMEDVRTEHQRPKLDRYPGYYYVALRCLHYQADVQTVDTSQVSCFLGRSYLVTIHGGPIPALDAVHDRWRLAPLSEEAAPFLFYLVLDGIVDSYFPVVDAMGDLIDEVDTEIARQPETSALRTVFRLRRSLLGIRRILGPLRDALNELMRSEADDRLFELQYTTVYFNDVHDHVLRLTDFVDTYREMLSGSLDAYQSSLSNRLNENMQRLTVAATVLATGAMVTGFYGMNLHGLGIGGAWPYGAHAVAAGLAVVTAIELWLFRRAGWF